MNKRPFYAPTPMRLSSTDSNNKTFDVVFVGDFRNINNNISQIVLREIKKIENKQSRIGLVQRSPYSTRSIRQDIAQELREQFRANNVEMIVYGELVESKLIAIEPTSFDHSQLYVPEVKSHHITFIVAKEADIKYLVHAKHSNIDPPSPGTTVCFYDSDVVKQTDLNISGFSGYYKKVFKNTWLEMTQDLDSSRYSDALSNGD